MQDWIAHQIAGYKGEISAIGTGGNIKKIFELAQNGKIRKLSLTHPSERAGVSAGNALRRTSVPASAQSGPCGCNNTSIRDLCKRDEQQESPAMVVPDLGLKDGINFYLFEKHYPSRGKIFVRNS